MKNCISILVTITHRCATLLSPLRLVEGRTFTLSTPIKFFSHHETTESHLESPNIFEPRFISETGFEHGSFGTRSPGGKPDTLQRKGGIGDWSPSLT